MAEIEQTLTELRNRVLKLEQSLEKLAQWTNCNLGQTTEGPQNPSSEIPILPSLVVSELMVASDAVENVENDENLEEEIVCKVEFTDANDDHSGYTEEPSIEDNMPSSTTVENVQNNVNFEEELICKVEIMETNDENEDQPSNDVEEPPIENQMPSTTVGNYVTGQESLDEMRIEVSPPGKIEKIVHSELEQERDCSAKRIKKRSPRKKSTSKACTMGLRSQDSHEFAKIPKNPWKRSSKMKLATARKACSQSSEPFVSLERLTRSQIHLIKTKAVKQWKCPHCPKTFSYKSHVTSHIRTHTGERPFRCPHCPQTMKQAGDLRSHIRSVHPEKNQNLLRCRICDMKFPSQKNLTEHMKKHLKCYFCSRTITKFSNISLHLAVHTGERAYKCPYCLYATKQEGNLRGHAKIHK